MGLLCVRLSSTFGANEGKILYRKFIDISEKRETQLHV